MANPPPSNKPRFHTTILYRLTHDEIVPPLTYLLTDDFEDIAFPQLLLWLLNFHIFTQCYNKEWKLVKFVFLEIQDTIGFMNT